MKTKVLPWNNILREGRWSAELLISLAKPIKDTIYPLKPLGDVLTERKESIIPSKWPDFNFLYIGLEDISTQVGLINNYSLKLGGDIKSVSGVCYEGDILYGRLRPYLNKVALVESPIVAAICSGEVLVLIPNVNLVSPLFIREVLASDYVLSQVQGLQQGSSLPRLKLKDLFKIKVPIPPIEEQILVADRLRELRSKYKTCYLVWKNGGSIIRTHFENILMGRTQDEEIELGSEMEISQVGGLPNNYKSAKF